MHKSPSVHRLNYWLLWIAVNAGAFALATLVSVELTSPFASASLAIFFVGAIVGAIVGPIQEIILSQEFLNRNRIGLWTLSSVVGGGLGWLGAVTLSAGLFSSFSNMVLIFVAIGASQGAIVGFMQWWVLRKRVPRAIRWIGISSVGRAGLWLVNALTMSFWNDGSSNGSLFIVKLLITGAMGGTVYGATTGWLLTQFMRERSPGATGESRIH